MNSMHFSSLTWLFLFLLFHVSHSDSRTSQAGLFCGTNKSKTVNYVPTFVQEMENLSKLITTSHFATYHVNLSTPDNKTTNSSSSLSLYALTQCHRDLSQTDCLLCYVAARTTLPSCLPSLSAHIFLDGCFLRYDNYMFYKEYVSPVLDNVTCSTENASVGNYKNENEFLTSVGYAVGNVLRRAMRTGSGFFGTAEVEGVYALAQCWESVGRDGCRKCLEKAGKAVKECGLKREGRSLNAGCYLRYSNQKFFNDDKSDKDGHVLGLGITMAISLATAAFIAVFLFAAYVSYARIKKKKEERKNLDQFAIPMKNSCLSFKYETLEKATDYFSASKKLGQGGAGSVYVGTLPNGKFVAVKRLVFNTRQWVDEFFNEVNLISKIQHKNLVKLLGCSIEGPESLLVYEYVPNKSLDQFLFEDNKTELLNWEKQLKIIIGIAEGLAYLHGGSDKRIIHRDIKSSNILLDEDFTPKIADFGLARNFAADKSHLSTGVAGTLGYMAPEYLVRGQLTEKADVYSFGVLVLEIVCGRRNNLYSQDFISPLQTVWTLYRSDNLVEAVDSSLNKEFPVEEATKVLQIGLLCTQAEVALRPSMAQVISMLTTESCKIPIPCQPPFMSTNVMKPESSAGSHSTKSFIANATRKIELSYTSTESSSIASSDRHS
ncbi:cysteine-rich receptor-like protein kinase 42 isoform X2 [Mangifera indica]|uniref:cysteine-rich receptor-like protein kinase 42 isoform X2 n=1 Tax=Mangifera indica TaxID=29780 RepID=UPI001CFB9F2C|nr:cysteine-rich receptor-like protein kinase 42 isoform X2 [Mangifera indica]